MGSFLQDLRFALRVFRKNPGLMLGAITAISLGIGVNTAVFSVINAVLLQPFAYPDPARIVQFVSNYPDGNTLGVNVPEFAIWKAQQGLFQYVTVYDAPGPALNLTDKGFPEQVQGKHVTADFFRLFGAQVVQGRTFTEAEDRPNGGNWVVLGEGLWRRHFAADPHIVGKSIELGRMSYTVVGVVSSQFTVGTPADIYLPFQFDLNSLSREDVFNAAGRLRPGVTLQAANAQLKLLVPAYQHKLNLTNRHAGFSVENFRDSVVGDVRSSLLLLGGAVGMVLLIACANVANLLLVRATARQQEMALRVALGASRARVMRQLLTESTLLSLVGGGLGLILGIVGVHALFALSSGDIPRIGPHGQGIVLDWRVLAFTMAISLGSGIFFGLVPALRTSRVDLQTVLKNSSARTTDSHHRRVRSVLVVMEMALAVVLVIGTALLIRTFVALRQVDPGFEARNVMVMDMSVEGSRFERTMAQGNMVTLATQEVERIPGIEKASASCSVPLSGNFDLPFSIVGQPSDHPLGSPRWITISPHYFDVFGMRMLRGRVFTDLDNQGSEPVVIINETMARKYWPHDSALGKQIVIGVGVGTGFADVPREIVGIVSDAHEDALNQPVREAMYLPVAQVPDTLTSMVAEISPLEWSIRAHKGRSMDSALQHQVEQKLLDATGGLPVGKIQPMEAIVRSSTARSDFTTLLLAVFGAGALFLAAIGMYGLMAYSVVHRTQEIGVRMALGADRSDVRRMILVQGMKLALIGVALGLTGSFLLVRFLTAFLFGVRVHDPAVFILVPVFLTAVALGATWFPATRATRIAPSEALRQP